MESRFVVKEIDEVATTPYLKLLGNMPKKDDTEANSKDSQGSSVNGSGQMLFATCQTRVQHRINAQPSIIENCRRTKAALIHFALSGPDHG